MIRSSNLNCGLSAIGKNKCWLKKKTRTENRKNSQKYTDDDVHFPPACKHLLWRPLAHLERQYEEEEQGRKNSRSCFSEHLYPAFACFLEKSWRRRCYNYLQEFLCTCPFRACYVLPVHIHTDLTRVNDGRLSVQLFVIQQSTLDIIYPSQKKLWDFSLRRTYNILFGKDRSGRRNDIQHDMS